MVSAGGAIPVAVIIFGELVGKIGVFRIECAKCGQAAFGESNEKICCLGIAGRHDQLVDRQRKSAFDKRSQNGTKRRQPQLSHAVSREQVWSTIRVDAMELRVPEWTRTSP